MSDRGLWLDGNAVAGLLGEAFAAEMTTVPRRCQSCNTVSPVGAHRAYRGAGIVLRCPACGDLALRIATLPDRQIVLLQGEWTLERRRP
jgi:hypothetical protein